jgi:DNA polymerase-3 subunit delta'
MAFSLSEAVEYLRKARANGRLGHAYLITGPAGSGKRELARQICAMVAPGNASDPLKHPDVTVDQVRELERALQMRAGGTGQKVAIIFDADRLQPQASNAFLKTLEEPPPNSLLLLVTSQPDALLETILSRCIQVTLRGEPTRKLEPHERKLAEAVAGFLRKPDPHLGDVFSLLHEFQAMLAEFRREIEEGFAEDLKREEAQYAKTTDGSWLEGREGYYKALAESHYVLARAQLLELLLEWWAGLLRRREGYGGSTLPELDDLAAGLEQKFTAKDLLNRLRAAEELRDQLTRTVQEALSLEVAFLKMFPVAGARPNSPARR